MNLGFIGLGAMGGAIAGRLLEKGHEIIVFDVNADSVANLMRKGALSAANPAEVASRVETVMVCLPTPDVVRSVALGAHGLIHGTTIKHYVDLSTTGAKTAISVASELQGRNISCLDAPVSGGIASAVSGSLALMVSGNSSLFKQLEEALNEIGNRTTYVGPEVGEGQMMKLINNLLVATSLAAASEALVLGTKAGLDLNAMLKILNVSSGRSFATERIIPETLPERSFDFGFRTELMYKDVRLCLEEAEALSMPMLLGNNVKQVWSLAMAQNAGHKDFSAIVNVFEDWAGVQVAQPVSDA